MAKVTCVASNFEDAGKKLEKIRADAKRAKLKIVTTIIPHPEKNPDGDTTKPFIVSSQSKSK